MLCFTWEEHPFFGWSAVVWLTIMVGHTLTHYTIWNYIHEQMAGCASLFVSYFSQSSQRNADSKWICQYCNANTEPALTKCYETDMMSAGKSYIFLAWKEKDNSFVIWKHCSVETGRREEEVFTLILCEKERTSYVLKNSSSIPNWESMLKAFKGGVVMHYNKCFLYSFLNTVLEYNYFFLLSHLLYIFVKTLLLWIQW